jgi:hypothetical protein
MKGKEKCNIDSSEWWWIQTPSAKDLYKSHIVPSGAVRVGKRARLIRFSLNQAWGMRKKYSSSVQFLEFGVHSGKDLVRMAAYIARKEAEEYRGRRNTVVIHGFDSFRGLPEDWDNGQITNDSSLAFSAGKFDLGGDPPILTEVQSKLNLGNSKDCSNIELHSGWFEDSVPYFFKTHETPIAFVHADADLYRSTMVFLKEICNRKLLKPGSVLVFDEYTNYENWQDGEYRAWNEICTAYGIEFRYLCYHAPGQKDAKNTYGYQSVSVVITKSQQSLLT